MNPNARSFTPRSKEDDDLLREASTAHLQKELNPNAKSFAPPSKEDDDLLKEATTAHLKGQARRRRRRVTSKKAAKKTCAPGYAVYNYRKTRKGVFYDCAPKRKTRRR